MRILVTGATGFIGQRLCVMLEKDGHQIIRVSRSLEQDGSNQIKCDLSKEKLPKGSLEGLDVIFHLAAFTHDMRDITETIEDEYRKLNVVATENLAIEALKNGVKNFIFVSSIKAGGLARPGESMTEIDQREPDGVYGSTKRQAELALLSLTKNTQMKLVIVRPCLVYGPNVKGNLQIMLNGIQKGWFPPLPETGNRRSMAHVDDVVAALDFVLRNESTDREIYIISDLQEYSSRNIYEALCFSLGLQAKSWAIPVFVFRFLSYIHPKLREKVQKLLGDEYYSSAKLQQAGFFPKMTLSDINFSNYDKI